ncbi:hypothetical protein L6164_014500 [Bauhinia variegata]|uniref:Uncharacterized protein n=1 Tax=Bauhinia variegata TaxID=167791 RepID=A0ACB9NJ67_BAUVA|nr:hypothetical protein L6164_014500 [Bauhinia variegata]
MESSVKSSQNSLENSSDATNSTSAGPGVPRDQGNASASASADTNAIPNRGESSENIPISSMAKNGNGSEIQNPPTQVMERPGDDPGSPYRIPSHVFAKSNTTGEWSLASNESLFSIHMGNMSFSREMAWMKSGELGSVGDMSGAPDAPPSSTPPTNPNQPTAASTDPATGAPVNKLNDITPKTGDHVESPGVTEAKAAETMREVIRETTEERRDLSFGEGVSQPNRLSHQSDGSTKSFVFPILAGDGNKTPSSKSKKGVGEKHQQKQSEAETPKETPDGAQPQATKSLKSTPQNKWLSCFSCCTFCQ